MKKLFLITAALLIAATGVKAQDITLRLTQDQYETIKKQVNRENDEKRTFHSDWANYKYYAKDNAKVNHRPTGILFGNSITRNWWRYDSTFIKQHDLLCRGISGQVTSQMLCRFRQDVINLHPGFVAILAGINDIALNNGPIPLERTFDNIVNMCELAKANGIRPVLCLLTPTNNARWRPQVKDIADQVIRLNEMIKAYAKKNKITVVDYYTPMLGENKGMKDGISEEGLHPNLEGYKIMEDVLVKTLKLKKKK